MSISFIYINESFKTRFDLNQNCQKIDFAHFIECILFFIEIIELTYPNISTQTSTIIKRINSSDSILWEVEIPGAIVEQSVVINNEETKLYQMLKC